MTASAGQAGIIKKPHQKHSLLGRDIRIGFDNGSSDRASDIDLLREVGCERIYTKETEVIAFSELIPYLRPGDVVVITNLSHVGSSVGRLIAELAKIHSAGAKLEVANTEIMPGTPVGDSFAHVCAILAQHCAGWPAQAPKEAKKHSRGRPPALNPEKNSGLNDFSRPAA